jgi:hypothetical protein
MAFLKNLLFRHSKGVMDYFSDAVRIYAFKGEEDARWAAVAAAKVAGKKQKKFMIDQLSHMMTNVLKNYPNKPARKNLADRLLYLQEEIESRNGNSRNVREAEEKLLKLNEEYCCSLRRGDSSVFRRKHPQCF